MIKRASLILVPIVLAAIGVALYFHFSSDPGSGKPVPMMKDPEFRAKLDAQVAERNGYAKTRNMLEEKMIRMIEQVRSRMPGADDAAVRAELEKDPEWNSLYQRMTDINKVIGDNRRHTVKIVHDRMGGKNL